MSGILLSSQRETCLSMSLTHMVVPPVNASTAWSSPPYPVHKDPIVTVIRLVP